MIFVTVGTQLPFDRLIRAVDAWASTHPGRNFFAQIGASHFSPKYVNWVRSLDQAAFKSRIDDAELIVSHAGMGTILTALELGKPLIVMPRRAELGEHRNDHQLATARHLEKRGLITVANDETGLIGQLERMDQAAPPRRIRADDDTSLLRFIHNVVAEGADAA